MRQYQGLPASSGIAIGPAWIYSPIKVSVKVESIQDPDAEWLRLMSAVNLARNQVQALEEKARVNFGDSEAAIFGAHLEFLDDVDIMGKVHNIIFKQSLNAECAVETVFNEFARDLAQLPDPYLAERANDLHDISHRLLRCLVGADDSLGAGLLIHPSIVVAEDLTPSDTVQFDKKKILGICTAKGGPTSHTAILARGLGVPAIVSGSFDIADVESGILTVVDGNEGIATFGPTINELNLAKEKRIDWECERDEQIASTNRPAATLDNHIVEVVANIGGIDDAKKAVEMGAEGVGLFRTEFLYLDRTELLEISEQTSIYRGVVDVLGGRPLVVRTLDIGGDKNVPYLSLITEANPFLGWRGIRMVRERPDLLANQFEALLLAGVGADLRIMLPMVSGVGEVIRAREILEEVRESLLAKGKPIAEKVQFGIMVEVPSAALLAEHFVPYVDFYSIGTNDLTQYSLAIDRTNERVAVLASPFNPAVLKLVSLTIEAAHKHGKWVGMCGELAGEPTAVPLLLGMGLDEFSMAPASVPPIKQAIRKWSLERSKEVAKEALSLPGSSEVIKYLKGLVPS